MDLVGGEAEGEVPEDGEVVAGQSIRRGLAGPGSGRERGVFAEKDGLVERRSPVVMLDRARGRDERGVGEAGEIGVEAARLGEAGVLGEEDYPTSGRLQADPTEPGDAGVGRGEDLTDWGDWLIPRGLVAPRNPPPYPSPARGEGTRRAHLLITRSHAPRGNENTTYLQVGGCAAPLTPGPSPGGSGEEAVDDDDLNPRRHLPEQRFHGGSRGGGGVGGGDDHAENGARFSGHWRIGIGRGRMAVAARVGWAAVPAAGVGEAAARAGRLRALSCLYWSASTCSTIGSILRSSNEA